VSALRQELCNAVARVGVDIHRARNHNIETNDTRMLTTNRSVSSTLRANGAIRGGIGSAQGCDAAQRCASYAERSRRISRQSARRSWRFDYYAAPVFKTLDSNVLRLVLSIGRAVYDGDDGDERANLEVACQYVGGETIWRNCVAFLRLSERYASYNGVIDPLDTTRIHPDDYSLARKIAADATDTETGEREQLLELCGRLLKDATPLDEYAF
jgi:hypothetical protein